MNYIVFIVLRRMRIPLLALIGVYTIAIIGLMLAPGTDAGGHPWHMDLFHAFYVVSYTATTIGFGELPYPYSGAQRLWITFVLYAGVVCWLYALGSILTLLQNPVFQQALAEQRFARRVARLREPFYLVCGYGETGRTLLETLVERGNHAVVIESDTERVNALALQNLRDYVPALGADARKPENLARAGLGHPRCAGVVAVTPDNEANLKIAITAKLLHPGIRVIARADSRAVERNMASFGTDHIVDPFDAFAASLSYALNAPCLFLLHRWLTGAIETHAAEPVYPPTRGRWLLCGYGRFGKAVHERLRKEGAQLVVLEATPETTGTPPGDFVKGTGTEAPTLQEAGVNEAVGLVAGTNNDTNNLSIIMTARELNPKLFVIARQNQRDNDRLFQAVGADMIMNPSNIVADRIRALLSTPMLRDFLGLAQHQDNDWSCQLVSRIAALTENSPPEVREIVLREIGCHAIEAKLDLGGLITVRDLLRDPGRRERNLDLIVLLIVRAAGKLLLPAENVELDPDDHLLLCGSSSALRRLNWTLCDEHTLNWVLTGTDKPRGRLWSRMIKSA